MFSVMVREVNVMLSEVFREVNGTFREVLRGQFMFASMFRKVVLMFHIAKHLANLNFTAQKPSR